MRSAALAAERAASAALADLRRGVASLATVAATAPLVGIGGTVAGIGSSFKGCGCEASTWRAAIAAALAESLYPCAWGLLLGIFAFVAYRGFSHHAEGLKHELGVAGQATLGADGAKGAAELLRAHLLQQWR